MNAARLLPLTLPVLLAIASLADRADAYVFIKVTESNGDVTVSATGSLNLAALTSAGTSDTSQGIDSSGSFLEISSGPVDLYQPISGPSSFGTGAFTFPSSGGGDRLGIRFGVGSLAVPAGYISGAPLSGTSTYTGKSYAQLGLTPGYYTWKWGSGANADSLTLKVEGTPTPTQAILGIDANQNPLLQWQADIGSRYSISYSTDLKNYVSIAKGFPFGGALATTLTFTDLPIFTRTFPKGFYKIEKDPATEPKSRDMLTAFFDENGGKAGFTDNQVKALETVLFALDEIEAGQLVAARARVDAMLAAYPLSTGGWYGGSGYRGLNLGSPIGYYAVRMLDQILTLGNPSRKGKLRMTAVVAATATVSRPTLPNFAPEISLRNIAPEILADDARRLHLSTRLFRRWVQAISGGLEVELKVHVMEQGAVVYFNLQSDNIIVSYPKYQEMVDSVPTSLANTTDIWWVVAPSGVPGDGSGFNREFITGGMGADREGLPLIISDDGWFTRKPEHLGSGPYSEVELMMYQPQWLQHEFMHHLFRIFPELNLELTLHQWFVRSTWPADFVGAQEPDYYTEALNKRILGATPTVAQRLSAKTYADMSTYPLTKLVGSYQRLPVTNPWHEVTISLTGGNLRWSNAATASWGLEVNGSELWSVTGGPYQATKLRVQINEDDDVVSISFAGDSYQRVATPANRLATPLNTNLAPNSSLLPPLSLTPRSADTAEAGGKIPVRPHCTSCFRK
jgi:hypothetical protein